MKAAQIVLYVTFFLCLEMALRSLGVLIPFLSFLVFYFTVLYGWRTGLILGLLCGAVSDALAGYPFPVSALSETLVVLLSQFWLYRVESDSLLLHATPGALIPLLVYLPLFLCGPLRVLLTELSSLVLSMLVSACLLPLFLLLLDTIAEKLRLPLYTNVKPQLRYGR